MRRAKEQKTAAFIVGGCIVVAALILVVAGCKELNPGNKNYMSWRTS